METYDVRWTEKFTWIKRKGEPILYQEGDGLFRVVNIIGVEEGKTNREKTKTGDQSGGCPQNSKSKRLWDPESQKDLGGKNKKSFHWRTTEKEGERSNKI